VSSQAAATPVWALVNRKCRLPLLFGGQADERFFRRGHTNTYRDELSVELHKLFWSQPNNRAAMRLLGYAATSD